MILMGHVEFPFGKYNELIQVWSNGILSHNTETNTHLAEKEINPKLISSEFTFQIFLLSKITRKE